MAGGISDNVMTEISNKMTMKIIKMVEKNKLTSKRSARVNEFIILILFGLLSIIILASFAAAQGATVCCEKTISGLTCQNVPADECAEGAQHPSTSCDSTSFCKLGVCRSPAEGTCITNTPQTTCSANGGFWTADSPPECANGCCILGDEAAFVTQTRCKKLSASFGLNTTYDRTIDNEVDCILKVQGQEKGACVYNSEFQKSCKLTTKADCAQNIKGEFYKGKLCSAESLGTVCGPTQRTTCLAGKEEVYFVDSCGNAANIYDSGKLNDADYWTNIKQKDASCGASSGNMESRSCGNCNYLLGSICRSASSKTPTPSYGDNICVDLRCKDENNKMRLNGESWCANKDAGSRDMSDNSVGSRFYREICSNGEIIVEGCEDYRKEVCIESLEDLPTGGKYSYAACRVNRYADCFLQSNEADCANSDKRDCRWIAGVSLNASQTGGTCAPLNSPGLKFWEGDSAQATCALATTKCVEKCTKGLLSSGWSCSNNCGTKWQNDAATICQAEGDCGIKVNWMNQKGYKNAFNITSVKIG